METKEKESGDVRGDRWIYIRPGFTVWRPKRKESGDVREDRRLYLSRIYSAETKEKRER